MDKGITYDYINLYNASRSPFMEWVLFLSFIPIGMGLFASNALLVDIIFITVRHM